LAKAICTHFKPRTTGHQPLTLPPRASLPVYLASARASRSNRDESVFVTQVATFGGNGWVSRFARRGLDAGVEQVNFRIGDVLSWMRQPYFQASPAVRASRHAAHSHPWGTAMHRLLHATRSGPHASLRTKACAQRQATWIRCRSLEARDVEQPGELHD